jgi:hypothetical protein
LADDAIALGTGARAAGFVSGANAGLFFETGAGAAAFGSGLAAVLTGAFGVDLGAGFGAGFAAFIGAGLAGVLIFFAGLAAIFLTTGFAAGLPFSRAFTVFTKDLVGFLALFAAAGAGLATFAFFTTFVAAIGFLAGALFFAFCANFFIITNFSKTTFYR